MKHIRMKTTAADPDKTLQEGRVYQVGAHVSAEEAATLVKGGYAVEAEAPDKANPLQEREFQEAKAERARENGEAQAAPENAQASNEGKSQIEVLSEAPIAAIKAALPKLSNEDIEKLQALESAKDAPRKGALDAITAEIEDRTKPQAD